MSRSNKAQAAAAVAGAFAVLAGAATFLRRRRLRRGGAMQDTKEIARRVLEGPWQGKLDEVLELVGDDYVGHVPASPSRSAARTGSGSSRARTWPRSRTARSRSTTRSPRAITSPRVGRGAARTRAS